MQRSAKIDPTGRYRYRLQRRWASGGHSVLFVLLNPSTADALVDDRTLRRCIGFARHWGHSALTVCNLFAWRATDPRALKTAADPVGPSNDRTLHQAAAVSDCIVVGWGARGTLADRDRTVCTHWMATPASMAPPVLKAKLWCLGTNKNGTPKHPLYVRADAPLVRYVPRP